LRLKKVYEQKQTGDIRVMEGKENRLERKFCASRVCIEVANSSE